jgi:hypothetical protein
VPGGDGLGVPGHPGRGPGLLKAWDRASAERFVVFLGLVALALGGSAWLRAPRAAWAGLAAVWLALAFGGPALSFLARNATVQGELSYLKLYRLADARAAP